MSYLMVDDPEVARIVRDEESRVESTLDLIAAENHAPASILEAQGSIFNLMMDKAMLNCEKPQILKKVAKAVQDLCKKFPINK